MTVLVEILSVIAAVCIFAGLALFVFWVVSTSVYYDAARWPGILGMLLLVVGVLTMIPSIGLWQKMVDQAPTVRAEAFTVEAQTLSRSGNKTYVVQVDGEEMRFYDFEISDGDEEYVEYKTELGVASPERLVVSEETAEALGRVQIGK